MLIQGTNLPLELLDFIGMQLSGLLQLLDLPICISQLSLSQLELPEQICPLCVDYNLDSAFLFPGLDCCGRMNSAVARSLDSRQPWNCDLLLNFPLSATW